MEGGIFSSSRISITDGGRLIISFDLDYASNFREDAYTWCYTDFFIRKPDIDIPDSLKRLFTRFIDSASGVMYWRHREIVRIIDMDMAVEYVIRVKRDLEREMDKYDFRLD